MCLRVKQLLYRCSLECHIYDYSKAAACRQVIPKRDKFFMGSLCRDVMLCLDKCDVMFSVVHSNEGGKLLLRQSMIPGGPGGVDWIQPIRKTRLLDTEDICNCVCESTHIPLVRALRGVRNDAG